MIQLNPSLNLCWVNENCILNQTGRFDVIIKQGDVNLIC